MLKSAKVINGVEYRFEVFMAKPIEGMYRFGLQGWPRKGNVFSYSMRLSEEFIEDEIDNSKNKEYLEKVAMRAAENHIGEMLSLNNLEVIGNLTLWFREAKNQLDQEGRK